MQFSLLHRGTPLLLVGRMRTTTYSRALVRVNFLTIFTKLEHVEYS